ncbi:MAG: hypothetical protein AAFX03_08680 [Pseudomonadota bacterium]
MAHPVKWIAAAAVGVLASAATFANEAAPTQKSADSEAAAAETPTAAQPAPRHDAMSSAAAVYGTYQSDVTDVKDNPLSSTGDIDAALNNLGGHNPGSLSQGWLAYSALVASQSPEYRDAVRDIESFYGRDRVLRGMRNDLRYARSLEGGDLAVGSALAAIDADSRRLSDVAAFVKEQAYTLQGAGWAKAKIRNSSAKADEIGTRSRTGSPARATLLAAMSAPDFNTALVHAGGAGAPSLWDGVSGAATTIRVPSFVGSSFSSPAQTRIRSGKEHTADRIATLAAYHVLSIDGAEVGQLQTALADREAQSCLNMAQLNLQQCVAAAHQHHELPFCISEHALNDISSCIGEVTK